MTQNCEVQDPQPSNRWVVKYDTSGNQQWLQTWTQTKGSAEALAFSGSNILVAGRAGDSFDGHTFMGTTDVVAVKYQPGGTKIDSHQYGSTGSDDAAGIAIGPDGGAYVVGTTSTCFAGAQGHVTSNMIDDIFLLSFSL